MDRLHGKRGRAGQEGDMSKETGGTEHGGEGVHCVVVAADCHAR